MKFHRQLTTAFVLLSLASTLKAEDWTAKRFDRQIAAILANRCLQCHSGANPKGKLDLSGKQKATQGGESGAAIVGGKLDQSLLWKRIVDGEMPPDDPLPKQEREIIRQWIVAGAVWGTTPIDVFRHSSKSRAGYDWWALQPVKRPDVPSADGTRNAIDAFIRQKLKQRGLTASPQASPEIIIRRLTFDLLGLPPSPEEISAFQVNASKDFDAALEQLIERLLASRHFGERWGRHWLDVVRFGESQGFERDKLRNNSWHYRDWVIAAMNADMPYDQFTRLQLAGDVLHPSDPDAVTATGFMVAGPWDEVGQSMRSKAMKAVVRQDEVEDYVGTISQTFLGLTVNCARCHDHKFDPIRQKEYYQIASAVGGVRHGSRNVISKQDQQRREKLSAELKTTQDELARLDAAIRNRLIAATNKAQASKLPPRVKPISRWDFQKDTKDQIGEVHAIQHPKAEVVEGRLLLNKGTGYAASHMQNFDLSEKTLEAWVKLDNLKQRGGAAFSVHTKNAMFDAIVFGERHPGKWMAGSDFFKRTKDLNAPQEKDVGAFIHMAITYAADGTIACYRNGVPYGSPYKSSGPAHFRSGEWYVLFGLRTGGPTPSRQMEGTLETAQLYDRALTAEEVRSSFEMEKFDVTHDRILAAQTEEEKKTRASILAEIASIKKSQNRHAPHSVYAVVPKRAETTHLLLRGNPATPGDVVSPGGVASVSGVNANFGLAADAADSDRRKRLADWIASEKNPLFARVIVNRLWHYHFGIGLVDTPNDFGFNGGRPSHPELIDYLATELIESSWSLKHVHRLIVSSATYLQDSRFRSECAAIDADNRLLWRRSPLRLEAEALRDAILTVSGQMNPRFGGSPYRDFTSFSNNSTFYEIVDLDKPEVYRRTIYRTWIRSGRNHLLDAFDCPDPSTTAPKRTVTTTPIQAMTLMNNPFILRMADRFAQRVTKDVGKDAVAQTNRVYQLAYGRTPNDDERKTLSAFINKHGLSALCRVVINSNEFIHVD
ncbi:MAG: hypothetical protein CMJ78_07115 [Planctomycetaceae bacterium]|nr:hypothetical protein [Planctomycetaceae bacterium]